MPLKKFMLYLPVHPWQGGHAGRYEGPGTKETIADGQKEE